MRHFSGIWSTCICPTKQRALRVVSQAVWQTEILFNQHSSVGSIHVGGLNLGGIAVPVSPVKVTVVRKGMESVRYRTKQILVYKRSSEWLNKNVILPIILTLTSFVAKLLVSTKNWWFLINVHNIHTNCNVILFLYVQTFRGIVWHFQTFTFCQ